MCHHAEFGHFRSNRVRISSGEPAKLRFARDKPPRDGGRGWSKNKQLPHVCYHAKFGRSSLKSVVIDRGNPQKLGSAGAPPFWDGTMTDP